MKTDMREGNDWQNWRRWLVWVTVRNNETRNVIRTSFMEIEARTAFDAEQKARAAMQERYHDYRRHLIIEAMVCS